MESRSRKYLKKAVKIALRIVVGFVLLFILVAALIQIPSIQSSIVHRITSAVSDKTGTTVEVEKVRIAFLKSVVVQGVFLDDPQGDTLLSAERIKINIALKELLVNQINVNSISLNDVTLNLSRDPSDSLFNYQFLIASFTDTSASQPKEPSPWSFTIDRLNLENIDVRFDDRYGGIDATLALQQLRLGLDGFDPKGTEHYIKRLEIDGFQGDIIMVQGARAAGKNVALENEVDGSTPDTTFSASDGKMKTFPKISVRRLAINGSSVSYKDLVSRQSARADLDRFELTNGTVNLENETVALEKFFMAESGFHYAVTTREKGPTDNIAQKQAERLIQQITKSDLPCEIEQSHTLKDAQFTGMDKQQSTGEKSNWKISVDQIELKDNVLSYLTEGAPVAEDHLIEGSTVRSEDESEAGNEIGSEVEIEDESEAGTELESEEGSEKSGKGKREEDRKQEGEKKSNGKGAEEGEEVEKEKGKVFLAGDMEINLHSFSSSGLHYSSEEAGGTINSFSATDKNGFAIEKFSGVFRFDEQSLAAEKFQLATNHSAVAANLQVQYPSLQALQDSIASVNFTLDLQQLQLRNSDLLYFVPHLSSRPYLTNPEISTSISGKLSGNIADLAATELQITTGERTRLRTDLAISGLPAVDRAVFSVPGLHLTSGRQDIGMLAGELLPEAIVLPERLSMELAFHGMLNAFRAAAELESSYGDLKLSAQLGPGETFSGRFGTGNFDLGQLLGDTAMFGPLALKAEMTGSGLERSNFTATVRADLPKLTLNNYLYRDIHINGTFSDQMFEGQVGLEDENLVVGFDGLVNLRPGEEHYQFRLDLQGAGLQQLNFTEDDIRIGLLAEADVRGTADNLQGRIDLLDITAAREEQLFILDSLSADFTNIPGFSEVRISSKLLEADYSGTVPPTATINELGQFLGGYLSLFSKRKDTSPDDMVEFGKNDEGIFSRVGGGSSVDNQGKVSITSGGEDRTAEEADSSEVIGTGIGEDGTTDIADSYEVFGSREKDDTEKQTNFNFSMKISNHPILSEVLFPALKSFEPVEVEGQFDSELGLLELDARMKRFAYGPLEIDDLAVVIDTDSSEAHYALSTKGIATEQVELANLKFAGHIGQQGIVSDFTSIDDDLGKKLEVHTRITRDGDNYRLVINPDDLFLMYNRWEIDPENRIIFGEEGVMIDRLYLQYGDREVRVASVDRQFNDDLSIDIRNFRLDDVSKIIENDPELVKGTVNGTILVKRSGNGTSGSAPGEPGMAAEVTKGEGSAPGSAATGIIADASVSNLIVRGVPVGDLTVTTTNPASNRFELIATLSGAGNDLSAAGYIISSPAHGVIDITADIASLSMKTAEAFSAGQLTETAGTISGNAKVSGSLSAPEVTGELRFSEVFLRPAVLNNRLRIVDETVELRSDGLFFDTFTVTDPNNQSATLDGTVKMQAFTDLVMDLQLQADNFLLMNTTVRDNETVFGRMVIDSDIDIRGSLELPVVRGRLKLKEGSHATFVVPESRLTTDRGEDVVVFEGSAELHPILEEGTAVAVSRSDVTGIDLSTILEIDRQATLRLLMDPTSTDSLVVKGEAALSLAMDRSGKLSLTGVYSIFDGSYLVSLESVIKRRFVIVEGSSITWNGDPLDATLSLDARYTVRASPYDLVAAQVAGLSDADKGAYRQQLPFRVLLKLRGDMLQPEISFGIELPEEERGALGGALNQKLAQLNQDASALNKQVFALLLLGRFMQENPLQAESGSTAAIVRSTVGNFLSAQLNRLGAGVLPGTQLNVDIQSYEEYEAEQPQGRTEVEVGIRQQLFNERLSVQVGGSVDVEGERALENRASEITGDVRVEYKLTEDGRLRLKGFRQDRYEGALEGQIIETGAGVSYVRDFNEWKELFRSTEKEKKDRAPEETASPEKDSVQERVEDTAAAEDPAQEKDPEPAKEQDSSSERDPESAKEQDSSSEKDPDPSDDQDTELQGYLVIEREKILKE
ncbi:MAG: translocation/assembly module TamB domain-containing protein [Bacteroidales bacterium]